MDGFGLRRSQTQKITPGDGDCLFHSVLDGYNNLHPGGSMFERKADNTENTKNNTAAAVWIWLIKWLALRMLPPIPT